MDTWMYLWCMSALCLFLLGVYLGYGIRIRDEADGVVSALHSALQEGRVPLAVRQEVVATTPPTQLLAFAHWRLRYLQKVGLGTSDEFRKCRSIASRLMRVRCIAEG